MAELPLARFSWPAPSESPQWPEPHGAIEKNVDPMSIGAGVE